jgi:hypothetical protein
MGAKKILTTKEHERTRKKRKEFHRREQGKEEKDVETGLTRWTG